MEHFEFLTLHDENTAQPQPRPSPRQVSRVLQLTKEPRVAMAEAVAKLDALGDPFDDFGASW